MTAQHVKYWELFLKKKSAAISPTELEEFESWIRTDVKYKSVVQEFEEIFHATESTDHLPNFNPEATWNELNTIINMKADERDARSVGRYRWIARIAATMLLILGFTYIFYQYSRLSPEKLNLQTMVQTDAANQKMVELPDGTTIWLNINSELLYPETFDEETRTVYLKGEAYFEVARDENKPFIIHSGISKTTVIGTSFNLRAYSKEDEVKLTVITGKVAFALADDMERVIVTPGNMAVLSTESKSIVHGQNTDVNFLSWKSRHLLFNDSSLEDLIQALERHYGTSIVISNPETLSCRFTGDFKDTDLENTIKIITRATGTTYDIIGGQYIIQGAGCE